MDDNLIIIAGVFGAAWVVLLVIAMVLCCQVRSLKKKLDDVASPRIRVQKLTVENDTKNHAYHNPAISPDEELSKRGYSMYVANEDAESGRGTERQTGGQFVEELSRELEHRHQRQAPPPFLLQNIEDNKRRNRDMVNPIANQNHNNPANHNNSNFNNHGNPNNHSNFNSQNNHDNSKNHSNFNSQNNHANSNNHSNVNNHNNHGAFNNHHSFNHSSLHSQHKGFGNNNVGRQSDTNPNFIY